MNQKFNLTVLSSLPIKEGFSLDKLVIEVRRMFEAEKGVQSLVNELKARGYSSCPS